MERGRVHLDLDVIRWDSALGRWTARQDGIDQATYDSIRLPTGELKVLSWEVTASGELRRLGDHTAGDVSALSLSDRVIRGGRTYVTTPVRLPNNALKVIAFETNL